MGGIILNHNNSTSNYSDKDHLYYYYHGISIRYLFMIIYYNYYYYYFAARNLVTSPVAFIPPLKVVLNISNMSVYRLKIFVLFEEAKYSIFQV